MDNLLTPQPEPKQGGEEVYYHLDAFLTQNEYSKKLQELCHLRYLQGIKKSLNDCTLIYRSSSDPSESKTFEFREGQDKRLGPFSEFVPSNTIQGMLAAIKQFRVLLKRIEH